MHRRDLLVGTAALSVASTSVGADAGLADPRVAVSAPAAVAPLPFKPSTLKGLSARLVASHHEKNYGGAVSNLNKVRKELAALSKDAPPFLVGALKERELSFGNSAALHEAYFANLGGDGRMPSALSGLLSSSFGSAARFEQGFRATGMSLSGGSGWVILGLELSTGVARTYWSGNHTQGPALTAPLLVMDMYEHSYQLDYGAAADQYIDAFFRNIQWGEVQRRLERAQKMSALLRG